MPPNTPNRKPVLTQSQARNATRQAAWLLAGHPHGAGLSVRQLGEYMGKSGGWVSYLAQGKLNRISVTPDHAHWLRVLYTLERSRHKATSDELAMVAEIRTHLGQAIGKADELARRIAARRKSGR